MRAVRLPGFRDEGYIGDVIFAGHPVAAVRPGDTAQIVRFYIITFMQRSLEWELPDNHQTRERHERHVYC